MEGGGRGLIRAVLIDDERPAIREMEYLLQANAAIEVVGTFTNPLQALQEMEFLSPQVVFLDINMPQLQGIDVASRLLDLCPQTNIIFVTAHDQYAVEAFELHALDYLLKPILEQRFNKTLQRIVARVNQQFPPETAGSLTVTTFGRFSVGWTGEEPIRWRTEKTRELFAFLLHNAGREVRKEEILEAVFSGMDPDKAVHQLHNGIYYIKKTLQTYGVSRNQASVSGSYRLSLSGVKVDCLCFQELLCLLATDGKRLEWLQTAEAIYTADYFFDSDWAWAEARREKLRQQYLEVALSLSELCVQSDDMQRAEGVLLKAYGSNPYSERVIKLLLSLYLNSNRTVLAHKHYRIYAQALESDLGIRPSVELRRLMASY